MKNAWITTLLCLAAISGQAKVNFDDEMKALSSDGAKHASPAHKDHVKAAHQSSHAKSSQAKDSHGAHGEDPWKRLMKGNQRHRNSSWRHPNLNQNRRAELAKGQKPFAAILSCADSRVAPELVFDQGLGDLFVVRVAGNVAGPFDRASLEYGVEHLGIGLLVVLGHEKCGAVKASMETAAKPGSESGLTPDLKALVHEIEPAVKGKNAEKDLDAGVVDNAKLSAKNLLERSDVLRKAVEQGHLKLVTARYDLDSGEVETLP